MSAGTTPVRMRDFGKKTTGANYENPQATWQEIVVIGTNGWIEWNKRKDKNDWYQMQVQCPNCKGNTFVEIRKGYTKPRRYMCCYCETLQVWKEPVQQIYYPTVSPMGAGGGVGY